MKKNTIKLFAYLLGGLALGAFSSCNDFLDREPLDQVTPEVYLNAEDQLAAYAIAHYNFPTHSGWGNGTFNYDNHTDNQATSGYSSRFSPGEWRVGQNGGSWSFSGIRECNYFLEDVLPKWKAGSISGNPANIEHYIGEMYFIRAYEYFNRVQALGDFPIIRNTLPDQQEVLTEASKRRPRNEVARFIISDLDSAIMLMNNEPDGGRNRLTKLSAQLFKSRVALHEGSWLKYHKGTARVPGGPGWPGANADYLSGFSIDIDAEINYFLGEAMKASKEVIDAVSLVANNGDSEGVAIFDNPYYNMFAANDMSDFDEVLFWRSYNVQENVYHQNQHYLQRNGGNTGYTKGFVESFLMENGLPIYAAGSGYVGDATISDVKELRDDRLKLFMKAPGEQITDANVEPYPDILGIPEVKYVTGYAIKKGVNRDDSQADGSGSYTGSIVFRAAEAYLNYIEAAYVLNGSLDATATNCWVALRTRAGLDTDFNKTIAATDMTQEAQGDWGAYSGGNLVDATLYNIRRERRCELVAEGMRYMDLKRWRALDQVSNYQIEGFNLWGGVMQDWYLDEDSGESLLIPEGTEGKTSNVSSPANSDYLRPYQIVKDNNLVYNGYNWHPAHYLSPIAYDHFLMTSGGEPTNSVIYQNPNWPIEANGEPID
ncbi:RagB/SusD family nutrient uptake outer membrane protein [Carboxylicivirga mesophila]|uniref:RagB/SusD family nutrient uptake outer membrane protein n=1 Tax=Carboxylicivirga mesophila TaxID=1166478 RepID=A0ABS5K7J0_9BACT|nr:RagB/SusD family nutrient uptake outer membrane protein [Carboxylicivirga mesophila]MBS2210966.1 RagB/SusD family nutrient uptake outer membrane protein [Carboxylicivirga mesophila]